MPGLLLASLEFLHECRLCPLHEKRTRVVRPEIPANWASLPKRVLLIGEAPGKTEDIKGIPFIGAAGKLLRDTLESFGISDVAITNSCKCRPPNNRPPKTIELVTCHDKWLQHEIKELDPTLIVCLGLHAANSLLGCGSKNKYCTVDGKKRKPPGLNDLRRRDDLEYNGWKVQIAYHPSAALRMAKNMAPFVSDIRKIAEYLGVTTRAGWAQDYREVKAISQVPGPFRPVSVDTEYDEDGLFCYSFSYEPGKAYVCFTSGNPLAKFALSNILSGATKIVMHNAPADVPQFKKYLGTNVLDPMAWRNGWYAKIEDTMVLAYVLGRPTGTLGLKELLYNELGLKVIRLEEVLNNKTGGKFEDVPKDQVIMYSGQDADGTLQIWLKLIKELDEQAS